ncbi:MAG: 50S ribosomal protein L18 [Bacteroidales bacterium]|mgnify:FL=1|nr:50S ribosomal protein L18 [Bacteroidales bacterium]NLK81057.1 50S ribosomal protein L18 [Bacteroidales bacterium]
MAITKLQRRVKIKRRIREIIEGSAQRPRMSVFRSNKGIYVQLIDDLNGTTLLSASSIDKEIVQLCTGKTKTEQASVVGETIAKKAIDKGINTVVFDRNGYLYHGRIKTLAESARNAGLKF